MAAFMDGGNAPVLVSGFRDAVIRWRVEDRGDKQAGEQHQHGDAAGGDLGAARAPRHAAVGRYGSKASHVAQAYYNG